MTVQSALRARGPQFDAEQARLAFAAASLLLRYPDQALLEGVAPLAAACERMPRDLRAPFVGMCRHLSETALLDLQMSYVATFDLKRRCCLYLSYYLNGDTRRRGTALWRFQEVFRRAGQQVVGGELADFLPALLELAATQDVEPVLALMNEHRAGLLVLVEALEELDSPYAGVVRAIEHMLPPCDDRAISEARRMVLEGPPLELVGIDDPANFEPYGMLGSPGACGGHEPVGVPIASEDGSDLA